MHTNRPIFAFPEINLNRVGEMDGWAALKILNTPNHPQRAIVQRRVRLVTRTVGERFIRLRNAREAHNYVAEEPEEHNTLGGDQYVDPDTDPLLAWLEDYEFDTNRTGRGYLPEPDEIQAAYQEALDEIQMLRLANYRVSHHTGLGWSSRWPRIGDLVDVPADLHADLETEEPLEERPSAANHLYDDRWFDNHRPNYLGFDPDPIPEIMSLQGIIDERGLELSILADRANRSMWEVGIWKLSEYGQLQVRDAVCRKYRLFPDPVTRKFTPQKLCKFIVWAHRQQFAQRWEWEWITQAITALHVEEEPWCSEDPLRPRRKFNWRRAG